MAQGFTAVCPSARPKLASREKGFFMPNLALHYHKPTFQLTTMNIQKDDERFISSGAKARVCLSYGGRTVRAEAQGKTTTLTARHISNLPSSDRPHNSTLKANHDTVAVVDTSQLAAHSLTPSSSFCPTFRDCDVKFGAGMLSHDSHSSPIHPQLMLHSSPTHPQFIPN